MSNPLALDLSDGGGVVSVVNQKTLRAQEKRRNLVQRPAHDSAS
jgi:hypothetical protein